MRTIWLIFPLIAIVTSCTHEPTAAEKQDMLASGDLSMPPPPDTIDRGGFLNSLHRISISEVAACVHANDLVGQGHVRITFDPSTGHATAVDLEPPFDRASNAACMIGAFEQITLAPFQSPRNTLRASFDVPDPEPTSSPPFDVSVAKDSVNSVDFSSCKKMVTSETGEIFVIFSPHGSAVSARIVGTSGSPTTAKCIEQAFVANSRVPPFGGTVRHWVSAPITIPN